MSGVKELVFVGESNPYDKDPRMALFQLPRGAAGNRLRTYLGISDYVYMRLNKVNLCVGRWSYPAAREAAKKLLTAYDPIVCLGVRVIEAFEVATPVWGSVIVDGVTIASMPHPSGLNRVWNDPRAREKAVELMKRVAPHIQWGQF